MRAVRRNTEISKKRKPSAVSDIFKKAEKSPIPEEIPIGKENIPQTIEQLQEALKWKKAYEQYHRITHGN